MTDGTLDYKYKYGILVIFTVMEDKLNVRSCVMTEEQLELMTIDMLKDLGYDFLKSETIIRDYSNVILDEILIKQLLEINQDLSDEMLIETIRLIKNLGQNNLILNNQLFSKYLISGISVPDYSQGETRYQTVKLIDYENMDNNNFLIVNQYSINEHSIKRPDLIIFINGLPLVVFELKSLSREEVTLEEAYNQLRGYMTVHIPSLFYYNQILVISDGVSARAGTITSSYSRFTEWKKTSIEDQVEKLNTHESLINGICKKETLLNLIRNYILYSNDIKILPAYHQYYGVEKAIKNTLASKDGRIGIIWHTQGSGKSFSMVFYTGNIVTKLNNPTIVVITDRNDLDNQLYETFSKCEGYLRQSSIQIESRNDLKDKLEDIKSGGLYFATLQKFEEATGLLSERENILVIVDEAHRSHYGISATMKFDKEKGEAYKKYGVAKYLRESFPNAKYIGFTGTPVETKDKSTIDIFGEIIDIYDMTQSIEDGSTVELIYESRMAKIGLNEQILNRIDNLYDSLIEEEKANEREIIASQRAMATMKEIIEDESRLKLIVKDIIEHYEERKNFVANKAMVVAYSRHAAYKMYNLFLKLRPDYQNKIKMIVTPSNSDSEEMQKVISSMSNKQKRETEFKNPNSDFKIAIVVDMWLTGFDVPSLGVMYIDKPMKAHNLMQAIARVNRVYKDKKAGLIVDYIGLKKWLFEALKTYTERDQTKIIENTDIITTLYDKLDLIRTLFYGFDYNDFGKINNYEKYQLINEGVNFILQTEEVKKRFLKLSNDVKALFTICASEVEHNKKDEVYFITSVRSFINKLETTKMDIKEINEVVGKMLEDAINEDELINIGTLKKSDSLNLLNEEMIEKLQSMKSKNMVAEILKNAINNTIKEVGEINVVIMEKFSERFKRIVKDYNERTFLTDIEKVIEEMIELKRSLDYEIEKGNEFDLTYEEKAFFDALGNNPDVKRIMGDEVLVEIAKELVDVINKNMTVDWDKKRDSQAYMRMQVRKLLRDNDYPPNN